MRHHPHDLAAIPRGRAHIVDGADLLRRQLRGLARPAPSVKGFACEQRLGLGARTGMGATEPKASRAATICSPSRRRLIAALALAMSAATRPIFRNALPRPLAQRRTVRLVDRGQCNGGDDLAAAASALRPGPTKNVSSGMRPLALRAVDHDPRVEGQQRGRGVGRRARHSRCSRRASPCSRPACAERIAGFRQREVVRGGRAGARQCPRSSSSRRSTAASAARLDARQPRDPPEADQVLGRRRAPSSCARARRCRPRSAGRRAAAAAPTLRPASPARGRQTR